MANTSSTAKRPATSQDAPSSAPPVATVRYGSVSAAIFAEAVTLKDGKTVQRFNVSLRRSYRNQESGDWRHTNVLTESDLLPAAEALRKCFEIIQELAKR